jgi:hypothetical protein
MVPEGVGGLDFPRAHGAKQWAFGDPRRTDPSVERRHRTQAFPVRHSLLQADAVLVGLAALARPWSP